MKRIVSGHSVPEPSELAGVALLGLAATVLLLANLGNHHLWQDEAQTALISQTILERGLPYGTDGLNFFSQELGKEYGEDYVWKWHTWLSFYLVAGSLALFGTNAFAARLPFALFGIATVVLAYFTGRTLWRDRRAGAAAAVMLASSVAFLLLCRQARWYGIAAFFSLLGLHAYARLGAHRREPAVTLFASATLLFHTHYFYAATLLATVLLHSALFARGRLRRVLWISAGVALLNLPWIVWYSSIRYGESYAAKLGDPALILSYCRRFTRLLWDEFFSPWLLLAPLGLALERWWRGWRPLLAVSRETWTNVALLLLHVLVTTGVLALVTPGGYFRYLAPVVPSTLLLGGLLAGSLLRRSLPLGAALLAVWIASNPVAEFAYELTHDFDGPIEGIVGFLNKRARPGDTVAITYGDMPVKFYTRDLRVVGGLTGEDLSPVEDATWIIPRRTALTVEERRVMAILRKELEKGGYRPYVIDYPDTVFQNRANVRNHRFRTARETWPRVVVYGRRR